ncbi:PAS domain-containing protein [Sulfuricurvum sp.]|uniref:PAS domain-containing protein n=1 Tax=Sulfuricurvum sp. TaxID=2025608 RepID=UPI003C55B907
MKETKLNSNELFFSITSHDSTILSGNDVFVRISGYTKDELIGSFHNIVRHPDMPRVIFKTLWDHIKAGKPIVAYVKNKTKEGGYYWVLAAVFPLKERYVSIRIKPDTKVFSAIRELYVKLLMAESTGGMDESERIMPELLREVGYESYEHFMGDALLSELKGRQNLKSQSCMKAEDFVLVHPQLSQLKSAHTQCEILLQEYDRWFEKIDFFADIKSIFEEKGMALRYLARDIVNLSLNTSVSSYKVANGGETFGILARDIRINAKENDALIHQIHQTIEKLSSALNGIVFLVSAIRLQIEMVTYVIDEVLCKNSEVQMVEMRGNICDLIALVMEYSDKTKALQGELNGEIKEVLAYLDQLEKQMMYLGYVQVYGVIEAAGSSDESARFGIIFAQLKALIGETVQEIATMQKMGQNFDGENRSLMKRSEESVVILERLHEEMVMIKAREENHGK